MSAAVLPYRPRRAAAPWEAVAAPDDLPECELVPLHDAAGARLERHRGVRRTDTGRVIAVVGARYGLVPHREVARAVHDIGTALDPPVPEPGRPTFPRERIRLFAGGRRMEIRLVVGTRYEIAPGESVYPGFRVTNSLDGRWAVRAEGLGVRLACANQLYAGRRALVEMRELHLVSSADLLAQLRRAIHAILARFPEALRDYAAARERWILAGEVAPALVAAGLPRRHAERIGAEAERAASHTADLTRWAAYQIATAALTHEIGPRVSPDRARSFERAAASALLGAGTEGPGTSPTAAGPAG